MKKEIEIYTNEGCSYCKTLKELLNKEKIDFLEKNAKDNQKEWQKIIRLTGLGTFPTIAINSEYYIPGRDFNSPEQIINFIKTYDFEQNNFSDNIRLLESFKTMAFSINQGMSRIMQQLNELKKEKDEHKSTD